MNPLDRMEQPSQKPALLIKTKKNQLWNLAHILLNQTITMGRFTVVDQMVTRTSKFLGNIFLLVIQQN